MINPILHGDSPAKTERYRVEPYVIAADVYSTPPHSVGGGWTWYTGSASWMYRLGLERLLGITRSANHLVIRPSIPREWKQYQVSYRFGKSLYHIQIESPNGSMEVEKIQMDGRDLTDLKIPLEDSGTNHEIIVTLK